MKTIFPHKILKENLINQNQLSNSKETIKLGLHLRNTNLNKEFKLVDKLGEQLPYNKKHITAYDFENSFGASPEAISTVERFVNNYGIKVEEKNKKCRMIILNGSVGAFNQAFNYNPVYINNTFSHCKYQIPTSLKDIVDGILDFHNIPLCERKQKWRWIIQSLANVFFRIGSQLYPPDIAKLYNFPDGVTGKGQSIGIIQMGGGYKREYLEEYFGKINSSIKPNISDVYVKVGDNVGKNDPGKKFMDDFEVYQDIEIIGSIASDSQVNVYFAPNSELGFLTALQQAVHDEKNNSVISISWGDPEENWRYNHQYLMEAFNKTLMEAALKGITVCAASGDRGSNDGIHDGLCHVDFPASSPYILSCGGTHFKKKQNKISDEIVWNDFHRLLGATGGGVSNYFEVPNFQTEINIYPKSADTSRGTSGFFGRGVPDVAGPASLFSGYILQVHNMKLPGGGTSSAAPFWASLIALLNEKLNTRIGYINPLLYKNEILDNVFHPIIKGNNGKYKAGSKWNPCTGLGSPDGKNLFEKLSQI